MRHHRLQRQHDCTAQFLTERRRGLFHGETWGGWLQGVWGGGLQGVGWGCGCAIDAAILLVTQQPLIDESAGLSSSSSTLPGRPTVWARRLCHAALAVSALVQRPTRPPLPTPTSHDSPPPPTMIQHSTSGLTELLLLFPPSIMANFHNLCDN